MGMNDDTDDPGGFNIINWAFNKKRPINFGLDQQRGATSSTSTLKWWVEQNKTYFDKLVHDKPQAGMTFEDFIRQFNSELHTLINVKEFDVCVWCTGSFDLDTLRNATERYGLKWVVPYWAYKDVRVARQIAEHFDLIGELKASHNAYEDCVRQIKYVSAVYDRLSYARTI